MASADHRSGSRLDPRNIVLIGMRASGKTTLGRELAARLGRPFLDLDDELSRRAGKDADRLLAEDGEDVFRRWEHTVLEQASTRAGHVIATGGGAVLHESSFGALAATGIVVYLEVEPAELAARADRRPRPPLTDLPTHEEVVALLEQRRGLYEKAAQIKIHATSGDPILGILQALGLA